VSEPVGSDDPVGAGGTRPVELVGAGRVVGRRPPVEVDGPTGPGVLTPEVDGPVVRTPVGTGEADGVTEVERDVAGRSGVVPGVDPDGAGRTRK
jgi:hypothetical protein